MKNAIVFMLVCLLFILIPVRSKAALQINPSLHLKIEEDRDSLVLEEYANREQLIYKENRVNYYLDNRTLVEPHIKYSRDIRGIYVNAWVASNSKKMNQLLDQIENSNLNAMVIDLKDAKGRITFSKDQNDMSTIFNDGLKKIIDKAHNKGIYVIGRFTVFKDPILVKSNPDNYALKYFLTADNKTIVNSDIWSSPYSFEVWQYNMAIAKKAVELGLDEIQFDYIRFPTMALNSSLKIRAENNKSKTDAITGFLKCANRELKPYNVLISADVFGLTTTVNGDLSIGQDITKLINYVDYISPMIYPSHYSQGFYGIDNPDSNPYKLIFLSLKDAKEKLGNNSYKLRPWLQDFTLGHKYKDKEVKDQIKAVYDNRVSGWILWNPRSVYTISAVENNIRGESKIKRWKLQGSELFQKK